MRLAGFILLLFTAHLALGNDFLDRIAKIEQLRLNAEEPPMDDNTAKDFNTARPKFLNKKTQKYQVNGTKLPFVEFDIGESYSGLLPIDNTGRELFFWFFPTSTDVGLKDITIWLNGGPGCSSLEGAFQENGPVVWRPGTYSPVKNHYSWNFLSNVVYVEQPVGTGFSRGTPNATNEIEVAQQFNAFWKNFVDLFDLYNFRVYVTGESYAGMFVPYIADGMLNNTDTKYYNVKGILIYDPLIGPCTYLDPVALPFLERNIGSFPLKAESLASLREKQESCGYTKYLEDSLQFPPKGHFSIPQSKDCFPYDAIVGDIYKINTCFNVYYCSQGCPAEGNIIDAPSGILDGSSDYRNPKIKSLSTAYFDREDVKQLLHAPIDVKWHDCNSHALPFDNSPKSAEHSDGPVARVAEKTQNVIIGHATQDVVLLSNATLLILNNLTWSGAQGFDQPPNKPLYVPTTRRPNNNAYKYLGSWTKSRGLTFVEINLSGHMVPQYQPGAALRHLEVLLGRVANMSEKTPFTISKGTESVQQLAD